MSLIFEALKKLEREKARQSSPIITAGEAPWAQTRSRVPAWALAGGGIALLAAGVALGTWFRARPAPETAGQSEASVASPAAAPPTLATPPHSPLPPPPTGAAFVPRAARKGPRPTARRDAPPPSRLPVVTARPRPSAAARPAVANAADTEGPVQTAEPQQGTRDSAEPRLQAISERNGRPIALINDRVMFEGETAGDLRVVRIGQSEVDVEWKGRRRTLKF